jgi:hypothetical protein
VLLWLLSFLSWNSVLTCCLFLIVVVVIDCRTDCRKKYEQNEAKRKAQFEMTRQAAAATNGGK